MNSTDTEQQYPPFQDESARQGQSASAAEQASLAGLSRSYFSGLLELVKLECRQALAAIPALVQISLLLLPLVLLAWIAASVLVAYLAYSAYPSIALAISVFLAIQLLTIYLLKRRFEMYAQRLKLAHSREEISRLLELGFASLSTPQADTSQEPPAQTPEAADPNQRQQH